MDTSMNDSEMMGKNKTGTNKRGTRPRFATTRSELTRMRRRAFLLGWFGISALFTMMIGAFVLKAAADGTVLPEGAPGGPFPSLTELAGADGIVAGLRSSATLLGVVTLSYWAIATAGDYSTGLVRLLVAAQPDRLRLLGSKLLALSLLTAAVTTAVTVLSILSAPAVASGAGISTAAWGDDLPTTVLTAWVNTYLALLVWGVIGAVIAVLTRSSAVAISVGVGYVLVLDGIVRLAAGDLADRLPGATLSALAGGGSAAVNYGTAIGLGVAYATIGVVVSVVVFRRRDITD